MDPPPSPSISSMTKSPDDIQSILPSAALGNDHGTSHQTKEQQHQLRRATYIKVSDLATMNKLDIKKKKLETLCKKQQEIKQEDTKCKTLAMAKNVIHDDTIATSHPSGEKKENAKAEEQSIISSTDATEIKDSRLLQRMLPFSGGFNLCLLVKNVNVVVDKVRVDKSQVRLAECEVGDETGTVLLRARDGQISLLQEMCKQKAAAVLRNCSIELYQGKYIRLAVSKWGKIAMFPDGISSTPLPPTIINDDVRLSILSLFDMVSSEWLESQSMHDDCMPTKKDSGQNPRQKAKNNNRPTSYPFYITPVHPHYQPGLVGGYNTNVAEPAHIMSPYVRQMYNPNMALSPYAYGQVQPSYLHPPPIPQQQQQTFGQYIDHGGYIRSYAPDYAMRLQMEAMALSAHQHHYHRDISEGFVNTFQEEDHNKNHTQQVFDQRHWNSYSQGQTNGHSKDSPQATFLEGRMVGNDASNSFVLPPHLSPDQYNKSRSMDNNEMLSLRLEAKSPMMNPNAAIFTASSPAYNLPNLTLPPQHCYPGQKNNYKLSNSNLPATNASSSMHTLSQSTNQLSVRFGQKNDSKNGNVVDAKSHVQVS